MKLIFWCALGLVAGVALTRETPIATPQIEEKTPQTMGITAALQHQQRGAVLVDLRASSSQNLPVPDVRNAASNSREIIVIGDDRSARNLKTQARIVGIVPPWTLKRDAHIPAQWEITTAQLAQQRRDFQVVDVRENDEWQASHIPDSRQISLFAVEKSLSKNGPKVALFCLTGHRSAFLVRRLRERGFANIYSVRGGWLDWKAQNRALKTQIS